MNTPLDLEALLCKAISERRRLRLHYNDGAPEVWRVEPYTLGYNSAGELMLNGWAERVGEEPLPEGEFQDFLLARMQAAELLEERFDRPKLGYVPSGGRQFLSLVRTLAMQG